MTAKYKNEHSKKICILQKLNSQVYDQLKDYLSTIIKKPSQGKKLNLLHELFIFIAVISIELLPFISCCQN